MAIFNSKLLVYQKVDSGGFSYAIKKTAVALELENPIRVTPSVILARLGK